MSKETLTNEEEIKAFLKSQEWQAMQERYGSVKKEELFKNDYLTSAEHKLFGSTTNGLEYYYNYPFALLVSEDIETINNQRENYPEFDAWIPYQGKILTIPIKLLPVDEKNLFKEEYLPTFEVDGEATDTKGKRIENLNSSQLEKIIIDYLKTEITKTRKQARQEAGFRVEE